MKNKKIIIVVGMSVFVFIVLILLVIFCLYKMNYPKVESISLNVENIELYVDDTYELKLSFEPENAKNNEVLWSTNNNKIISVSNGSIVALKQGNVEVCVTVKNNSKIKDCVDVNVLSKKKKFQKELVEKYRYKEVEPEKYVLGSNNDRNEFDFNNRTFTVIYESLEYTYHYEWDYIDGFSKQGSYEVKYYYDLNTKNLSCVGNSPYFHQLVCNYSGIQTTKNTMDQVVRVFDTYLNPDYELKDLY